MSNKSRGAGTGAHLQQVVAQSMELHRTIHVGFHGLQGMMPLTATHFQGEAMAATTKYRERLHHLKTHVLRSCNQCPAFISLLIDTEAAYSPWIYSTPPLVKLITGT